MTLCRGIVTALKSNYEEKDPPRINTYVLFVTIFYKHRQKAGISAVTVELSDSSLDLKIGDSKNLKKRHTRKCAFLVTRPTLDFCADPRHFLNQSQKLNKMNT